MEISAKLWMPMLLNPKDLRSKVRKPSSPSAACLYFVSQALFNKRLNSGVNLIRLYKKRCMEALKCQFLTLGQVVPSDLHARLYGTAAVAADVNADALGFSCQFFKLLWGYIGKD